MKWINHKILGASVAAIAGLPPTAVIIVAASSVLPDAIELRIFKHRGWSHGWWLYAFLTATLLIAAPSAFSPYILYVSLGAAIHLACDSLTMTGIPVEPFSDKRFAIRLFKTGDLVEYLITALFAAGAIALVTFVR